MTGVKRCACLPAALLFLSALDPAVYGQEQETGAVSVPAQHALGIRFGLNDLQIRDQYPSPFSFGGRTFASGVSFRDESETQRLAIDVGFTNGALDFGREPRDVTQYVGNISFVWASKVGTSGIAGFPLDVWLGGGLSSNVMNTDFNSIGRTPSDIYYDQSWYWSHALDIDLAVACRLPDRRRVSLELTSPLYRLVSRPGNGHHLNSRNTEVSQNFLNAALHGKGSFLWESFALQGEVAATTPLGERFDLRCAYRFMFASADSPFEMAMYANQFLLGLEWQF